MTNLPLALRQKLAELAPLPRVELLEELTSPDGLTVKTLFRLEDGECIEAVLMSQRSRHTACLSAQVGCAIGCPFCATAQAGFRRSLSSSEMLFQALFYARRLKERGKRLANIVFMGMGEPLANYQATICAVDRFTSPDGFGIGSRHIAISTAGLVPGIRKLAEDPRQVRLAISLHAAEDALRDRLVPLNRRYPLAELMDACRYYAQKKGRRLTFEYVLLQGINDSPQEARKLVELLRDLLTHINLIPMNPVPGSDYRPSSARRVQAFIRVLEEAGLPYALRRSRGAEIQAGCGQLRGRHLSPRDEAPRGENLPHKRGKAAEGC